MKKKDHICAACHRLCISEAPSWGKNSFLQERGPFLFFPPHIATRCISAPVVQSKQVQTCSSVVLVPAVGLRITR